MSALEQSIIDKDDLKAGALSAARSLARAIGESPVFRQLEAAQEAFMKEHALRRELLKFQALQQEMQLARMWGGAAPEEEEKVEAEWKRLSQSEQLRSYLEAQEDLREVLGQVAGIITEEIGIDYGAACIPAGGCC